MRYIVFLMLGVALLFGCINIPPSDALKACNLNNEKEKWLCGSVFANDTSVLLRLPQGDYKCNESIDYSASKAVVYACGKSEQGLQVATLMGGAESIIDKCNLLGCSIASVMGSSATGTNITLACNGSISKGIYFVSLVSAASYEGGKCKGFNPPFFNCTSTGSVKNCKSSLFVVAEK